MCLAGKHAAVRTHYGIGCEFKADDAAEIFTGDDKIVTLSERAIVMDADLLLGF